MRVSGGLTVGDGGEKRFCCDNLEKVQQRLAIATADVEDVAFLIECTP